MTEHNLCSGCIDSGLLVCTCEFYANWPRQRPTIRPWLGRNAEQFRFGHRAGRSDAARRLWRYLNPEGRQLATAIATEGNDE
ncbi:hypothetical protein ORI20_03220 [Mycobacterium sp. CVI_P3]|uniref:hypothetical protein n=1 Tax=Mycobacterium pinniadriaticum TaxID=2994102 RepID=UPI002248B8F8|nr:hypothetical protein [Mycobacterium pinniadriaticum]MCX2929271.1 hypothetical protein [Mycobacterium pinniadriaticum]